MRSGGDRQGVQQRDVGSDVMERERETPRGHVGETVLHTLCVTK